MIVNFNCILIKLVSVNGTNAINFLRKCLKISSAQNKALLTIIDSYEINLENLSSCFKCYSSIIISLDSRVNLFLRKMDPSLGSYTIWTHFNDVYSFFLMLSSFQMSFDRVSLVVPRQFHFLGIFRVLVGHDYGHQFRTTLLSDTSIAGR